MVFPNVPPFPGVPPLPRLPGVNFALPSLLLSDGPGVALLARARAWGVFNSKGKRVLTPDSIIELDRRLSFRVSDFPIEGGEFASYNKVRTPSDVTIRVSKGGTDADRTQFLAAVEKLVASLDLLTVVMPEASYASLNLVDTAFRRTVDAGFTLLSVDLGFRQIRVAPASQNTTERPLSPTDSGAVQPVDPTTSQTAAIEGA